MGVENRAAFSSILYSIISNHGDIKLAYQMPGIDIPEGSGGRYIEISTKKDACKKNTVEGRDICLLLHFSLSSLNMLHRRKNKLYLIDE